MVSYTCQGLELCSSFWYQKSNYTISVADILNESVCQTFYVLPVQICRWFIQSQYSTVQTKRFCQGHPNDQRSQYLKQRALQTLDQYNAFNVFHQSIRGHSSIHWIILGEKASYKGTSY